MSIDMHSDIQRILFSESALGQAVRQVAEQINSDYAGKAPVLVGILKGSVVFMGDLMRSINLPCQIDFMVVKSYGNEAVSSGNVKILKDIDCDIDDRDVIIVEDILDTAQTLAKVKDYLLTKNPASVKICALLDKKIQRSVNLSADYKCFDIENEFVVGYGLDYAEKYRNLPYIGVLDKSVYTK